MSRALAAAAALGAGLFLAGCLMDGPRAGGSSSDGEAKIAGTARYADGRAAARVRVRLRDQNYLSDPSGASPEGGMDALTDSSGAFAFAGVPAGSYALEANDEKGSAALLATAYAGAGRQTLPPAVLQPTGAVQGVIDASLHVSAAYVQVYGLERATAVDPASGEFLLPDLPQGDLRVVAREPGRDTTRADSTVAVKGRDTADVGVLEKPEDLGTWAHSRALAVQTSLLGTLSADQIRMPIRLVLGASDFPFAEARGHGEDVRFSQHGRALRYEIVGWDSAGARAEIWIRLDTLWAGLADQGLRMHWGRSDAASRSKGYGVYMQADSFRGVWHLVKQPAGLTASAALRVPDSSSTRNVGKASSTAPWADPSDSAQAPFGALRLDAANPFVSTTKTYQPGEFTISLWVRTVTRTGGRLFGMGDTRFDSSSLTDKVLVMDNSGRIAFGVAAGRDTGVAGKPKVITGTKACNDGRWHHVAAVLSQDAGLSLYLDGELAASDPATRTAGNFAGWWRMGWDRMDAWAPHPQGPWQGLMREAWVAHAAMPADWVRIMYVTGQPDSRLVVPAP